MVDSTSVFRSGDANQSTGVCVRFELADGAIVECKATVGASLMEAAVNHGVDGIIAECGGACSCGTCHIVVEEVWRSRLEGPAPMEQDMLAFIDGCQPGSRLACQLTVAKALDGLTVKIPSK